MAFFLLLNFVFIYGCTNKHYDLISVSSRKIAFTDNGYLDIKVFNNSTCGLSCKAKLTYIVVNNNPFWVKADFEKKFKFLSRDSTINQSYILHPNDSIEITCGCKEPVQFNNGDWNMDLTALDVKKINKK